MLVTITTDASFDDKLKIGSYAFIIVCDRVRFSKSGKFKDKLIHNQEAEFKSIVNAIYFCLYKTNLEGISKIIINTDCYSVIEILKDKISLTTRIDWSKDLCKLLSKYLIDKK